MKTTSARQDVFIISYEAEVNRLSRLMNRASKAFYSLKDPNTEYGRMLWACYLMHKNMYNAAVDIQTKYTLGFLKAAE